MQPLVCIVAILVAVACGGSTKDQTGKPSDPTRPVNRPSTPESPATSASQDQDSTDGIPVAEFPPQKEQLLREHAERIRRLPKGERWPAWRDAYLALAEEPLKAELARRVAAAEDAASSKQLRSTQRLVVRQADIVRFVAGAIKLPERMRRHDELVRILDGADGSATRAKALVVLAGHYRRTTDQAIVSAVSSVFSRDPCLWPTAEKHFEIIKEMDMRCRPFPSRDEVTKRVASLATLNDQSRRQAVRDLLTAVADSQNEREHDIAYHVMLALANDYRQRKDAVVLEVFDAFDFGIGGDAITACSFYHGILGVPEARQRYGTVGVGRRSLEECVGITISKQDLAQFDGVSPQ